MMIKVHWVFRIKANSKNMRLNEKLEWKIRSSQNVYTDNMTSFLTTFVLHHFQIYIFSFLQKTFAIIRFQVRKQVFHHGH